MSQVDGTVMIEDARLLFRNFSGREGPMNREGDRNFCVILDEVTARQMEEDGWNVKYLKPREDGDVPEAYTQVSVGYKARAPRVVMITSRGRTELDEESVEILDHVDIVTCDLIFRPYNWEVGGKTGVKAYLKSLFITIQEDELEKKYSDVPDAKVRHHEDD